MTIRSVFGRYSLGLLAASLLATTSIQAQSWQWASQGTVGSQNARINRVATDGTGNSYVFGEFAGSLTLGSTVLTSYGSVDGFIAKCSPSGQWLWVQRFGTTGIEYARALTVDAAGNAYVAGGYGGGGCAASMQLSSTITVASATTGGCLGTPGVAFLARISPTGTWQWAVSGNWVSYIEDISLGTDGTLTAAGTCNRDYTLGNLTSAPLGVNVTDDAFVARFTTTGQGIWLARALVNGRATGIGLDAAGNAYVCGRYQRTGTMTDPKIGATVFSGICNHNWFLAKVDASGEWMWATKAGSSKDDIPADVAVDANGNAYVTGVAGGAIAFGAASLPAVGAAFGVVAKCSPAGQWQWAKAITNCTAGPSNINLDAANNAYITGAAYAVPVNFGPHALTDATTKSFLSKVDQDGNWQWVQALPTKAQAVSLTTGNALQVAGSYNQNQQLGSNTLTASTSADNVFLARFAQPAVPTLASMAPGNGAAGTTVTLTGTRFNTTLGVKIGTKDATFTIVSPTELRVVVPAGATTAPITIFTTTGSVTTATFTVLPTSVSSLTPAAAHIGATVTIDGAGFVGVTAVKFGTRTATFTVVSPTRLTAVVPAGATTAKVSVTAGTTATSTANFTVVPPTATAFSPASGQVGATITIDGSGFTGATGVKFGTKTATFTVVSATRITAVVPVGATTAGVSITGQGGTGLSTVPFTVLPPAVTSFTPTTGQAGTLVTIDGSGFTGATSVKFGTRAATGITVVSPSRITALVPAGATTGAVSIVGTGGTGASAASFTVIPAAVSSFSPATGPAGTVVTLTGTGLLGATGVKFNGVPATSFTIVSGSQVRATVPAGATTGRLTVLVYGGGSVLSSASFSVTGARPTALVAAEPVVLNIYPNPAHSTLQVHIPKGAASVQVLDRAGVMVRQQPVVMPEATELLVSLDGLQPGVYTVRCGELTRRLIVE